MKLIDYVLQQWSQIAPPQMQTPTMPMYGRRKLCPTCTMRKAVQPTGAPTLKTGAPAPSKPKCKT